jgi:hypothetical protein
MRIWPSAAGALYHAFAPCEARRVLRRLEFHYVPKHASWLNMVEIEIGAPSAAAADQPVRAFQIDVRTDSFARCHDLPLANFTVALFQRVWS